MIRRGTIRLGLGNRGCREANKSERKAIMVTLTCELDDQQAWDIAQFLKRVGWGELSACAEDEAEAYRMRNALELVRRALDKEGFTPR